MSGIDHESALPRRVVAIGGGTGLPSMLRGFRKKMGHDAAGRSP